MEKILSNMRPAWTLLCRCTSTTLAKMALASYRYLYLPVILSANQHPKVLMFRLVRLISYNMNLCEFTGCVDIDTESLARDFVWPDIFSDMLLKVPLPTPANEPYGTQMFGV